MARLAVSMISTALVVACQPARVGEVVSGIPVTILEGPDHLSSSCVARGRVTATGTSAYRWPFFDNREIAESRATEQLLQRVQALRANTVVLDPGAAVEIIPLDAEREWGVHLEGDAYTCDSVRPAA